MLYLNLKEQLNRLAFITAFIYESRKVEKCETLRGNSKSLEMIITLIDSSETSESSETITYLTDHFHDDIKTLFSLFMEF